MLKPRAPSTVGGMLAEQRLWLAIVLCGVADYDEKWLESPEFRLCCENAGIDPFQAGHTPPARARQSLHRLLSGCPMNGIYSAMCDVWGKSWAKTRSRS
jgi:hypothetical protein